MKNYEKYADKIREYKGTKFCIDFVKPNILKSDDCINVGCARCKMLQMIWLLEEYEEPEVDWSKVEVDTPILVRICEDGEWLKKYFAKYEDGKVYAWNGGCTSWTSSDTSSNMTGWRYAKLAESEEE